MSDLFSELKLQYTSGIQNQDAKSLNAFVRDERFLTLKTDETRQEYVAMRCYRAECFILFGSFDEAIKECRFALAYASEKKKWEVYMLWAKLHSLQLVYTSGDSALTAIAQAAVMVAQKGRKSVPKSKDSEYQNLAFANIEAFFQLFLGEGDAARKAYQNFKFTPVPIPQYNDENALDYLFANYAKALAVAIELKDEKLLRNLMKVISIDDQTLYGEQSLFKVFHTTLVTTMDTHPNFSADFNRLFQIKNKLKPTMKELDFFLTSTSANMSQALEVFFNGFE